MREERDDDMLFFQHMCTVFRARHGKESVAKSTGTLMISKILASVKWHDFNLILHHSADEMCTGGMDCSFPKYGVWRWIFLVCVGQDSRR